MTKTLHVQAFGRLTLQVDGATVASFPTRHAEELFGYLLMNPHVPHSREKLITTLWPDCAPDKARGRFSTTLWRLRRLFRSLNLPAQKYLQATRDWVALVPGEPIHLDVDEFERLLAVAKEASSESVRERALAAALHLYRGDLCEGLYADWCLLERERLARVRLHALGRLLDSLMGRGKYQEAAEVGQTILALDPLREEVHRAIMLCYVELDQFATAVRQFQLCARSLMDELGILPMPETVTVYRQIVDQRWRLARRGERCRDHQVELEAAFHAFQQAGDHLTQLLSLSI